jgi:hypothetical protein
MTAIRDTAHHESVDITRARDPRQPADHRPAAALRNQVAQLVIESLESEPPPPPLPGHAAERAREGRGIDHAATRPSTPQSRIAGPFTHRQGFRDEESRRSHRAGWEASFDNLDRVLAE